MTTLATTFLPTHRGNGREPGDIAERGTIAALWTSFSVWRQRSARRRAALFIDDRTLADIGLIRAQIDHEAAKPFWQP